LTFGTKIVLVQEKAIGVFCLNLQMKGISEMGNEAAKKRRKATIQIRQLAPEGFALDSVVTVIDCVNFAGYEDTSPTAKVRQRRSRYFR
jgi:hypothetical protein